MFGTREVIKPAPLKPVFPRLLPDGPAAEEEKSRELCAAIS